jgi:twitching motility two-component system response regulator PilH
LPEAAWLPVGKLKEIVMRNFFRKKNEADESAVSDGERGTVLVVDDSPTEQHVLKNILVKAGFKVEIAENGELGIAEAKRLHPRLIIMDVVMPVLNGFQATRKLREDKETAGIPVIMVTTKDQETDKSWGLRQGAEAYLVKPVSASDLLERVEAVLGG